MSPPLLRIGDLQVAIDDGHGPRVVLERVDLNVAAGELVMVQGASGSGKSLLLASIAGLPPRGLRLRCVGEMNLNGQPLLSMPPGARQALLGRQIGWVPQEPLDALDPRQRIRDAVVEVLQVHHSLSSTEARQRAIELLDEAGLPSPELLGQRYPHQLSGGQRQRATLALALAGSPALLLADEPTSSLEAHLRDGLLDHLDHLRHQRGLGVIFVTHDPEIAARGDRQLLIGRPRQVHPPRVLPANDPPPGRPLLEITNLSYTFPSATGRPVPLLRDASLSLRAGQALAITGPSGCGKSTLLRMVVGLTPSSGGQVQLDGQDLAVLRGSNRDPAVRALRRRVAMVFQDPGSSLDPLLSVLDHLRLVILAHEPAVDEIDLRARCLTLLAEVGLDPSFAPRRPHAMSGGERQRVVIARALASRPDLVLCDEPTSALDAGTAAEVIDLLTALKRRRQVAFLLVTHDLPLARRFADEVLVLNDGILQPAARSTP